MAQIKMAQSEGSVVLEPSSTPLQWLYHNPMEVLASNKGKETICFQGTCIQNRLQDQLLSDGDVLRKHFFVKVP